MTYERTHFARIRDGISHAGDYLGKNSDCGRTVGLDLCIYLPQTCGMGVVFHDGVGLSVHVYLPRLA